MKRGGSFIDSTDWIKHKKVTINPINKNDNKYLQHVATDAVDYERIGKHPEWIIKIMPLIDKYNRKKFFH